MIDKINKILIGVAIIPFSLSVIIAIYAGLGLGDKNSGADNVSNNRINTESELITELVYDRAAVEDYDDIDSEYSTYDEGAVVRDLLPEERYIMERESDEKCETQINVRVDEQAEIELDNENIQPISIEVDDDLNVSSVAYSPTDYTDTTIIEEFVEADNSSNASVDETKADETNADIESNLYDKSTQEFDEVTQQKTGGSGGGNASNFAYGEATMPGLYYIVNINPSSKTHKVHKSTCNKLPIEEHQKIYYTLEEAYADGYTDLCKICNK